MGDLQRRFHSLPWCGRFHSWHVRECERDYLPHNFAFWECHKWFSNLLQHFPFGQRCQLMPEDCGPLEFHNRCVFANQRNSRWTGFERENDWRTDSPPTHPPTEICYCGGYNLFKFFLPFRSSIMDYYVFLCKRDQKSKNTSWLFGHLTLRE